ncbi:FGGY-family carbohydrate kinase [Novosphingobium panipatense]
MSANDWMAQDLADLLGLPVERPADTETTALGAAMLAGVGAGIHATLEDAMTMGSASRRFTRTWTRAAELLVSGCGRRACAGISTGWPDAHEKAGGNPGDSRPPLVGTGSGQAQAACAISAGASLRIR